MLGQPVLRIAIKQDQIALRYRCRTVLDVVESVGTKTLGNVVEGQRLHWSSVCRKRCEPIRSNFFDSCFRSSL
jgi:hypothetical protein